MRSYLTYLALLFALAGLAMSGYLSYYNIWGGGCHDAVVTCGAGDKQVLIFGQPTCIYGFFMYLLALIVLLMAWRKPAHGLLNTMIAIGVVGALFSGGLSIYELFFLDVEFTSLPACVYGLFFNI